MRSAAVYPANHSLYLLIAGTFFRSNSLPRGNRIKLGRHNPCPCGSGRLLQVCCLQASGQIRKLPPTILPPLPKTNFSQDGCYLAETKDCSVGLSAEHYMSRSILKIIGERVLVSGAPWLKGGEAKEVSINTLTAKILCRRHNSALSALDNEAGQFFEALDAIQRDFARKSLSKKHAVRLVSGEALEQWMLKASCGMFFSKNAAVDGESVLSNHKFEMKRVFAALLNGGWDQNCGLYMRAPKGHRMSTRNSVGMGPLLSTLERRVVGSVIYMGEMEFNLVFDPFGINFKGLLDSGWAHRPSELSFAIQTRAHSVLLTWQSAAAARSIRMKAV